MADFKKYSALFPLIGFGFVIATLYATWMLVSKFVDSFHQANPSVAAAVIGAMATAIVGLGSVLIAQIQTKRREIEEAHRPRKVEIYQQFLEMVARMMEAENPHVSLVPPGEQELVDFMVKFKTNVILWGSPDVIKAHLAFETATSSGSNILIAADKLYLAIRSDLGLSNKGLTGHQLIKMYLKDPSELDKL